MNGQGWRGVCAGAAALRWWWRRYSRANFSRPRACAPWKCLARDASGIGHVRGARRARPAAPAGAGRAPREDRPARRRAHGRALLQPRAQPAQPARQTVQVDFTFNMWNFLCRLHKWQIVWNKHIIISDKKRVWFHKVVLSGVIYSVLSAHLCNINGYQCSRYFVLFKIDVSMLLHGRNLAPWDELIDVFGIIIELELHY